VGAKGCVPVQLFPRVGRGSFLLLGRRGRPGLLSPLFLFCNFPFSVFLISLITFDFDIQMISTQLLKFSKTQNIIAKQ
jgi:hypothetical protein